MTDDDFRLEAQLDRARAERDSLRAEVEGLKREAKVAHDAASAAIALKEAAEAELAALKAQPQELHNVGPCVHGQCPWEPCAECGEFRKPAPLALAELKAQLATAREDALEEAALEASEHMAHACRAAGMTAGECIAKSIRALKKTTKGGGA